MGRPARRVDGLLPVLPDGPPATRRGHGGVREVDVSPVTDVGIDTAPRVSLCGVTCETHVCWDLGENK